MSFLKRWAQTTKTVEEGWSACFKKNFYLTIELAREVATKRMQKEKCPLYIYKCRICEWFHISKKKYDTSIDVADCNQCSTDRNIE